MIPPLSNRQHTTSRASAGAAASRRGLLRAALAGGAAVAVAVGLLAPRRLPAAPRRGADGEGFAFALIGDLPYTLADDAKFPNLIAEINAAELAFVVHDGDFKNDPRGTGATRSQSCTDELFGEVRELFDQFDHPLVYVPGDNEWTDCWLPPSDADPIERLAMLRHLFFATDQSLGRRTIPLARQSDDAGSPHAAYRENARWSHGGVTFATLNVTGSNNNKDRTPEMDAEWADRTAADLAWLRATFAAAAADGSLGLMVIWQANPWDPRIPEGSTAFMELLATLEAETIAFRRPVVLVHGDTHYFRVDKPLGPARGRVVENFTRVETFGTPNVHWVHVTVDPADPALFTFRERIVAANVDPR